MAVNENLKAAEEHVMALEKHIDLLMRIMAKSVENTDDLGLMMSFIGAILHTHEQLKLAIGREIIASRNTPSHEGD